MITQSEAHVDHAAPDTLYALIDRFVQERGIDPETVALTGSTDGCVGEGFQDADLHRAWVAFHNEHAVLRVVSVYANLGILKRKEGLG
jgi:hypothetical protein